MEKETGKLNHLEFLFILSPTSVHILYAKCAKATTVQQHQWQRKGKTYNGGQQQWRLQKSSHMHSFIRFTHLVAVLFSHCSILLETTIVGCTGRNIQKIPIKEKK